MPIRRWILAAPLLFTGCLRFAADPLPLTPETPYSSWTPLKGNRLISSRYCQTLLPPAFDEKELSLAELIDIALQNNPTTQRTWASARAAAAQYGQSLSPFMPNVEFRGSYFREKGNFVNLGPLIAFYTTTAGPDIQLTFTLFDFGQRSAAAMQAREALYYADYTHNQQIQTVLQTVMNDAYQYLYTLASFRAKEADLLTAQTSLDAANEKFSLGIAALGDVAQARTQFLQAKIALTTQRQMVEDAYAQLASDLGIPSTTCFKVAPLPEQVTADPILASLDDLVSQAQQQRQDFLAAQAQVRAQEASLMAAERSILPVLSTRLNMGQYWFQKGVREETPHWSGELFVTFPIFDGFYIRNSVRNAEANLSASKAFLMQTELSVIQSVTTARLGVKTAAENLKDTDEYLKAAELEFQIALTSYRSGTQTILDLLSAQSSLADARSQKAKTQRDWFTSLASLAYATGSLCPIPASCDDPTTACSEETR